MTDQLTIGQRRPPGVSDATLHLELRRRRSRRAAWTKVAILLVAAAVVGAAVWLLGFSSVLSARGVAVDGLATMSTDEVTSAAGVALGEPLARQDVDAIAKRVAGLRGVESVQVSRDWPHSVRVSVVERAPVLALKEPGGYTLIDRFGVAFRTVPSVPNGVAVAEVAVDQAVSTVDGSALLRQVGNVVQQLPDSLASKVATVRATSADDITLVLTNQDRIIWGSAEQSDVKAIVIIPLMKSKASVYDVSSPGSPAIR
ncbi:MAG TPA: FtsQ-type POTRA domain-containing protein [Propionibacteriaceae bacterium]|nr:FtsQ-type POTRA domain-containing protein [Propionibacteriaceae bacterium]